MCNLNKGCLPTEKKMGDFLFCKNLKQPWAINKPLWIKYISNSLSNSINCMQMNWNPCPVALLFHCPVFPFFPFFIIIPFFHCLVLSLPFYPVLSATHCWTNDPSNFSDPTYHIKISVLIFVFFFSSELLASHVHQTLSDHQRMIWWFWNIFLLLL